MWSSFTFLVAAAWAQACHADFNSGDVEIILFADVLSKFPAYRAGEFHDFAAACTQKMLVFCS
jgi:hypothetical protein